MRLLHINARPAGSLRLSYSNPRRHIVVPPERFRLLADARIHRVANGILVDLRSTAHDPATSKVPRGAQAYGWVAVVYIKAAES